MEDLPRLKRAYYKRSLSTEDIDGLMCKHLSSLDGIIPLSPIMPPRYLPKTTNWKHSCMLCYRGWIAWVDVPMIKLPRIAAEHGNGPKPQPPKWEA